MEAHDPLLKEVAESSHGPFGSLMVPSSSILARFSCFTLSHLCSILSCWKMAYLRVEETIVAWEGQDLMENKCVEQPRNAPNARRKKRVQPREVRVEDEENYGASFDEEDDRD
ncbi:hypothetical protein CRG98_017309 [Punica granatum]|uniref:Uncharacterized protein n=1 Tax=Punica granatum TaxID=22663 RepID=A0A2I0K178_PUNGR|nr:hypothetical protein CRG98_017309 [Punica granatum]